MGPPEKGAHLRFFQLLTALTLASLASMAVAQDNANATVMTGWRGNWSGSFPDAAIPSQWGKTSKILTGLLCQAAKPADDKPSGSPACTGMISQWLIAGPLDPSAAIKAAQAKGPDASDKPIDQDLLGDEANVQPAEGDKVQDKAWKLFAADNNLVDLQALWGKDARGLAYAHTYLYAPVGGALNFRLKDRGLKAYLNGTLAFPSKTPPMLKKGWNHLLVKCDFGENESQSGVYPSHWYFGLLLTAVAPYETDNKNILWQTALPAGSVGGPVICGECVFVPSEPSDLFCLSKKDGHILWAANNGVYQALTNEEKAGDGVRDLADSARQLAEIYKAFGTPAGLTQLQLENKAKLEKQLADGVKHALPKRFDYSVGEHHGFSMCTPVADGKFIYAWYSNGVLACYDVDGNRKWITSENEAIKHHGFTVSPILADGKVIVYMGKLFAYDAATGKPAWKFAICKDDKLYGDRFYETPQKFQIQGKDYLLLHGCIVNASDGTLLWRRSYDEGDVLATPVIAGGFVYQVTNAGKLPNLAYSKMKLPATPQDLQLKLESGPALAPDGHIAYQRAGVAASPLVYDGLFYGIDVMGTLSVVDTATGQLVYKKCLGLDLEIGSRIHPMGIAYASPILAGKYIYAFGLHGTTVVFEPGRQYKEVARNKLEHLTGIGQWFEKPEGFAACPAVEGNRLYLRGEEFLYCIGEDGNKP
jgi:outer membrane protein assembly factor BamB